MYISSGLGISTALVALSFSHLEILWQSFLIQGALLGIAIAFGAQPAIVIVGQHFARRRGLVMGIVAAAGSAGGFCFPLIFAHISKLVGLDWTLRIVAIIVMSVYITSYSRCLLTDCHAVFVSR